MAVFVKNELQYNHHFDRRKCRHAINGITSVLHCHHFATLTTQLANDCGLLDAKQLLADCAEDTFYLLLTRYFAEYAVNGIAQRIDIAEQYFSAMGLGKLRVKHAGPYSGEVELEYSHVDEGWLRKWGRAEKPVNHIGRGYITALFSAVYERRRREFHAVERQSIACGADRSIITVTDVKV